ncbi:AtuA-related protein [Nocardioides sp. GXQ0305]|uniref:AtuA-related protein n=1 Tax=Nocardioides sp. GXQ0305 TaxID=3423912 RepID=UPI003D7E5AB5
MSTPVDELADVRAGDKGDTLILAVLPRSDAAHARLVAQLTAERVADHFGGSEGARRVVVEGLPGLVFSLPGVLGGGVTGSTLLDSHGKTLGYHLLELELDD